MKMSVRVRVCVCVCRARSLRLGGLRGCGKKKRQRVLMEVDGVACIALTLHRLRTSPVVSAGTCVEA